MPVSVETRYDDGLCPILFNVIMDEIVNEVKIAGTGYKMAKLEFTIICHTDDKVFDTEKYSGENTYDRNWVELQSL